MSRKISIWLILMLAVVLSPIMAKADCSYSTKDNLDMAVRFLKDYVAYTNEGGDVNDDLAAAALVNLRHELDVTDWNDVFECGHRAVSYYDALDVHASLAEAQAAALDAAKNSDSSGSDAATIQMKISSALGSLGVAYAFGYSTYNPVDYRWLKQQIKQMAFQYHLKYKSPEAGTTPKPYAGPPNQWP